MNVIQRFRSRQRDMKTLSKVISLSLERAQQEGAEFAGAQHLVLTVLELDDGTAERSLQAVGSSGAAVAAALTSTDTQVLKDLGVPADLAESIGPSDLAGTGKYGKADATFEAAIQNTYQFHNEAGDYRPLVGAHILAGAVSVDRGVVARALRAVNVDRAGLVEAARREFG